ncbi:MAG: ribosome biogenesis GTPase Der [Candidatus Falkowbacteria bacterium]
MSAKLSAALPQVVIFGRTNVGKSSLFNCLREKRQAMVSPLAGTTRDTNRGQIDWRNTSFELIDTGGIIDLDRFLEKKFRKDTPDPIQQKIEVQAKQWLEDADVVLFVVDGLSGLTGDDRLLGNLIKKQLGEQQKKVILVVNKIDSFKRQRDEIANYYQINFGEPQAISAVTGTGTGDLLDVIVDKLSKIKTKLKPVSDVEAINIIILGQPNVGKSTLFNKLLGEERAIVSDIPHTTREPQDTFITYNGTLFRFIDTAGISRKGQQVRKDYKHKITLEKQGIVKTIGSIEEADIAILMVDISKELTMQEAKIVEEIIDRKKSLIIIGNKWDLVETKDRKKYTLNVHRRLPFIQWAPILFMSAKTGSKVTQIYDLIIKVAEERKKEIGESILNTFMMKLVKMHKPTRDKGTIFPRIRKFEQKATNPPLFELRIGNKESLHDSYIHFISNRLREKFGFTGTPIFVWINKGRKVHGRQDHGRPEILDDK